MAKQNTTSFDFMCINDSCKKRDMFYVEIVDGEPIEAKCPDCNEVAGSCGKTIYVKSNFGLLNLEGKKKVLQNRSKQHFNKKIKGYKEHLNNEIRKKNG
jgi:hypothetical protein